MVAPPRPGWTLIETMLLVAVAGVLAALALPRLQAGLIRSQVAAGLEAAAGAQARIASIWDATHRLPADNAAAGLPPPGQVVGNEIGSLTVEHGAIQLRYGRRANAAINGRTLSLRPVVGASLGWVCGDAPLPDGAKAAGTNRTDVPPDYLPQDCRGG